MLVDLRIRSYYILYLKTAGRTTDSAGTYRCKLVGVMAEIDRIVRPGGKLIVRDESSTVGEVENLLKSLHWEVHLTFSKNQEGILSAQKSDWRPDSYTAPS